jgi:hypothetical protein
MKKLLVGLLVLAFVLGPVSGFWSRPVLANTEEERKVYHCAAWPWNDDFPGVSNPSHPNSSGSSNVENSVEMRDVQKSPTAARTDSRELRRKSVDRSHFHRILHALWGVIFPESV